jgi:hypothetical protein
MGQSTIVSNCEKCSNPIEINNCWTPGGVNDYGGFILQCSECCHVFDIYIGRDIMMSSVKKGAKVLDTYDRDIDGDKYNALSKHGLA